MKKRWDIFCSVVDNYGDIGVCWRLARQLAAERGFAVRLWVDDLAPLARLRPGADAGLAGQRLDGVDVRRWPEDFPPPGAGDVADVVIEAFACELPPAYLDAMAALPRAPVWINLEYLSAEDWVEGCHGGASPHPRLPLIRHFFFPGFTAATGGLLREADYDSRRAAFDRRVFRTALGLPEAAPEELTVSLFGYENAAIAGMLDAWAGGATPVRCLVPEGLLLPQVGAYFGAAAEVGSHWRRGSLDVHVLRFLSQTEYDLLLWACDLNFVRGEDSFVRAQWAGVPFVWHIYPQQEDHHRVKLDAFLDLWLRGTKAALADPVRAFWHGWERGEAARAWPAFAAVLPALRGHAAAWSARLRGHADLATQLVSFAMESR